MPARPVEVPPWLDKYQRLRQALEIGFQQQQTQRKAEHLSLVKRERDRLNASLEAAKVPLSRKAAEADSNDKSELRKVFYARVREFDERQRGQAIAAEATFKQTQSSIASALADARKSVPASRLADWDRQKQRENAVWLEVHAKLNKQRAARDADEREKFVALATQKVQSILAARQQSRRTEQEQAIAQLESKYAATTNDRIAQLEAVFQTNEEEKSRTHAKQLDELRQELIADSKQSVSKPSSAPVERVLAATPPSPVPAEITQEEPKIAPSNPSLVSVDWPGFKLAIDQRIVTFGSLGTALLLLLRLVIAHRTYRLPEPDEFASSFGKKAIGKSKLS